MRSNYLNQEIKANINKQVDEFIKYLDFVECVEQINNRYLHFEQIGYAISCLIVKVSEKK